MLISNKSFSDIKEKEKMSKIFVLVLFVVLLIGGVQAAQISSDNFECGGFNCGSGWGGVWSYTGSCSIESLGQPRGSYHMRGVSACDAVRNFDNSDYAISNVSFYASADSLESGEYCRYYYYNGVSYTELFSITDGQDETPHQYHEFDVTSYGLSSNAGIRMVGGPSTGDYCEIDDINITGISAPDSTPPNINLIYPENKTYNINISQLNYTVSDAGLQACWYSLNNGQINTTITCGNNITGLTSTESSNIWLVGANDSSGNTNTTKISFFKDTIFPLVSYGVGTEISGTNFSKNWIYVNVSINENNFANITFNLYNSTSLINSTTFSTETLNLNWTNLNDNTYYYNVSAYDIAGNKNSTETRTINLDTSGPTINIILPESKTYGYNVSLPLNFSVSDISGVSSCWWNLDNEQNISLPNCQNATFNISEGSHTLTLYANDSLGNLAYASRSFSVNTKIAVSLSTPYNDLWLNHNNVEFNYSVETAGVVYNCSLWLNFPEWHLNQTNSSAVYTTGKINSFYLNLTDGNYKWNVFCSGTYSSFARNNYTLNIDIQNPILNIQQPLNNSFFKQNVSIPLNFSVSESNLQACWYNLGKENRTIGCINGDNNLIFSYLNGTYNLTLYTNDSANNLVSFTAYNITVEHDNLAPTLDLSEPKGTKTSTTGIPLQFSVSDNVDSSSDLTCWYNVTFSSTGGYVPGLEKISLANCQTASFNVLSDINNVDYTIYLSAKDRTGNLNITYSIFTVSTSQPQPPPVSGGGGGGGGGFISNFSASQYKLQFTPISSLIVNPGENKKLILKVKNTGKNFLNECKLKGNGTYSQWVSSSEIKGLAVGESYDFNFNLNVLEKKSSSYNIGLIVECKEFKDATSFNAEILEKKLDVRIIKVEKLRDSLRVIYGLDELANKKQNVKVDIALMGEKNERVAEYSETREIEAGSKHEFETLIEIEPNLEGSFNLLINANSDIASTLSQGEVLLKASGIGGFAILAGVLGERKDLLFAVFFAALFIVLAFFIFRRILRFKRLNKVKRIESNITAGHGRY